MTKKEIYEEAKKFGLGQTSRTDFIETWLCESPEGLGSFETFEMLEYNIYDLIGSGKIPVNVVGDLKKIEGQNMVSYWYEKDGIILLGCELEKKSQALIVCLIGKNPKFIKQPPYASDLYVAIQQDQKHSIRLMSDAGLSNEGYKIWKRLFTLGNKISIYDKENPGQTFQTFNTVEEMDSYFQNDNTDFRRYQYILSPTGEILGETRCNFHLRRIRELTPLGTEDYQPKI